MKRLLTTLMFAFVGGTAFGQWTQVSSQEVNNGKRSTGFSTARSNVKSNGYYKLDLNLLRSQLSTAQEMGPNAVPVVISLPTINGKIEQFKVYSFPVVVKELADKYQLGSYVGTSVDDPTKYIRFSLAPNDFQSMVISEGRYEFIEPLLTDRTVYAVHPKTKKNESGFLCSTDEAPAAKKQMNALLEKGKSFSNQPGDFSKNSDKKYRTMRLAMSVTGEYTQYFMTQAGVPATATDDQKRAPALAAINATLTRVNGVFEKDFALHLNLQDYPSVIYIDPTTDPYSTATTGGNSAWNQQLQTTLTANVGNANYDIGHLFGRSGGGGNAGCIGCVCVNPTTAVPRGKGSGFTSPANAVPQGDTFDIDYVAHEMGHQLGGNHTFSMDLEGSGVNMEPGSGSTIMGYAGITGVNTDVQANSDPYFHIASIDQIQDNLMAKTCDIETTIANNPPVISDLPTYNIPKGTAFVLTATATDPENNPMTYTWEEVDDATVTTDKFNLGNTISGPSFRSLSPSTSPTRYFPNFTSVMNGVLNNANNTWEAVSTRARTTNFAVTVRDNNPNVLQQQTSFKVQTIVVGDNGPFRLANQYADVNTPTPIQWIVANTNAAPYNVANVKIDYTANNGTSWTTLADSTPNDGSQNFTFPSSLNGQTVKVRISAVGNVFYAVGPMTLGALPTCSSSAAPMNVMVNNITLNSASVSWMSYAGVTNYQVRYRKTGAASWMTIDTTVPSVNLANLQDNVAYEVQVAMVCGTTLSSFSTSVNFTTLALEYCTASTSNPAYEYIANVTLANVNNSSLNTTYSNYTTNTALQINMTKGTPYPMSVTVGNPGAADYDAVAAFIDFNKDGVFSDSEQVLNYPVTLTAPNTVVSGNVTIPANAVEGQPLRMRVMAFYTGAGTNNGNIGASLNSDFACGNNFSYGEVEDYNVVIAGNPLSTSDVAGPKNGIQIYPNPVSDVLNVTKVSDKATYKIYSAAGQLIRQGAISNGQINVSELIKGGYVITVDEKGKESFTSKFIKK